MCMTFGCTFAHRASAVLCAVLLLNVSCSFLRGSQVICSICMAWNSSKPIQLLQNLPTNICRRQYRQVDTHFVDGLKLYQPTYDIKQQETFVCIQVALFGTCEFNKGSEVWGYVIVLSTIPQNTIPAKHVFYFHVFLSDNAFCIILLRFFLKHMDISWDLFDGYDGC